MVLCTTKVRSGEFVTLRPLKYKLACNGMEPIINLKQCGTNISARMALGKTANHVCIIFEKD